MYYTKYRPQKFSEVSKPNDVADALSKQVANNKTVHAYLMVGPRGTGKTTVARILAKALNCKDLDKNGDPCDVCDRCLAISNGSFLDLVEIDAASNRGIDDIRDLREKIKLAPSVGEKKVYIIDEVHMLTTEAFNALLKTLEEPPAHVTFILCTTEFHKVPETIRSRCQVFRFKRATIAQLVKKLEGIAKEEGFDINKQDLKMIASTAHGGFRDAETLLQQVVEGELSVESLTSIGTREVFSDFFGYLINKNTKEALHVLNKMYENGIDLYVWVGEFLKYLRELLLVKSNAHVDLVDTTSEVLETMVEQAKSVSNTEFLMIIETLMDAQSKIKGAFITQLPIELAIVKICNGAEQASNKVEKLPKKLVGPEPHKNEEKQVDEKTDSKKEDKIKEEKATESKASPQKTTNVALDIDIVINSWTTILKEVSTKNHGISALLKSAKVIDVKGSELVCEVPFDFYKERLESTKNRKIVEETISSVLEVEIRISCKVNKKPKKKGDKETGKLTDYNVMVPSGLEQKDVPEDILESLDGGLPFI